MDKLRKGINSMLDDNKEELDDYDLFDSIYYPAWHKGRDNYLVGEEEEIWNKLGEHFDLPPYEPASKENNYTTHHFLVNPSERKVYLAKGKDMIPLKRRIK